MIVCPGQNEVLYNLWVTSTGVWLCIQIKTDGGFRLRSLGELFYTSNGSIDEDKSWDYSNRTAAYAPWMITINFIRLPANRE